jgi:hypothetical protein
MEPNKFRESRLAINQMVQNTMNIIDQNELDASNEAFQDVSSRLDILTPQAEGEVQERSVKNLRIRVNALTTLIAKIKPKKKPRQPKNPQPNFEWDDEHVGQLSPAFLKKVLKNMADDKEAKVCFGTTGKGIRPSYQIGFSNKDNTSFSGSSHNSLKKSLSTGTKKVSKPFSYDLIQSVLNG